MLPDFDRPDRIGSYWGNPKTRTFAEFFIDCEEGPDVAGGARRDVVRGGLSQSRMASRAPTETPRYALAEEGSR
jgi:hypothetical protein